MRQQKIQLKHLKVLLFKLPSADCGGFKIITPRERAQHGCQLSIKITKDFGVDGLPARIFDQKMRELGVVGDERQPDIYRITSHPICGSYEKIWLMVNKVAQVLST